MKDNKRARSAYFKERQKNTGRGIVEYKEK
jgi:hypothetical protein